MVDLSLLTGYDWWPVFNCQYKPKVGHMILGHTVKEINQNKQNQPPSSKNKVNYGTPTQLTEAAEGENLVYHNGHTVQTEHSN